MSNENAFQKAVLYVTLVWSISSFINQALSLLGGDNQIRIFFSVVFTILIIIILVRALNKMRSEDEQTNPRS